jgi:hypothetical protein
MREHWAARGHAVQGGNHDASISYRKAVCVPSCTSPRLLSVPSRLYHGLPYRLRPLCSKEYEASNIPKTRRKAMMSGTIRARVRAGMLEVLARSDSRKARRCL